MVALQAYGSFGALGVNLQGAAGLFKKFENKTIIEMYGGYGFGITSATDDHHLIFAQFNIGKYDQRPVHFEYGIGLKSG